MTVWIVRQVGFSSVIGWRRMMKISFGLLRSGVSMEKDMRNRLQNAMLYMNPYDEREKELRRRIVLDWFVGRSGRRGEEKEAYMDS